MIFMKTQSNFYLFLIALISAMGGFLFGYDWVVIGEISRLRVSIGRSIYHS